MITACAGIAQLVEHLIRNEGVAGSNPVSGTTLRVDDATGGRPPKRKRYAKGHIHIQIFIARFSCVRFIFLLLFVIFDFGSTGDSGDLVNRPDCQRPRLIT